MHELLALIVIGTYALCSLGASPKSSVWENSENDISEKGGVNAC